MLWSWRALMPKAMPSRWRIACYALAGLLIADFIRGELLPSAPQSPRGGWVAVEGAERRYEIAMPELVDLKAGYEVSTHAFGGGRRDVLAWRAPGMAGNRLRVEVYWRGGERAEFAGVADEFALLAQSLGTGGSVAATDEIETKFGPMPLFAFERKEGGASRSCLGFVRSAPAARIQISGMSCLGATAADNRNLIGHLLDRLVLATTDIGQATAVLFAEAEIERSRCAPSDDPIAVESGAQVATLRLNQSGAPGQPVVTASVPAGDPPSVPPPPSAAEIEPAAEPQAEKVPLPRARPTPGRVTTRHQHPHPHAR